MTFALLSCAASSCLPRLGVAQDASGERIVAVASAIARSHVPYRIGGRDRGGFDCSGLVWYVHRQIGVDVPRRAQEQSALAAPVMLEELRPGDLLFFRLRNTQRVDHVGIYIAPGRLIHASILRHAVSFATLDDSYFAQRVASAGRLWGSGLRTSLSVKMQAQPDGPAMLF
jgi:cell wall-associated NlpC family hydrolase